MAVIRYRAIGLMYHKTILQYYFASTAETHLATAYHWSMALIVFSMALHLIHTWFVPIRLRLSLMTTRIHKILPQIYPKRKIYLNHQNTFFFHSIRFLLWALVCLCQTRIAIFDQVMDLEPDSSRTIPRPSTTKPVVSSRLGQADNAIDYWAIGTSDSA